MYLKSLVQFEPILHSSVITYTYMIFFLKNDTAHYSYQSFRKLCDSWSMYNKGPIITDAYITCYTLVAPQVLQSIREVDTMAAIKTCLHGAGCKEHDDVIKLKHCPRYWPFVRGMHRSPVKSPHKGQWRGALMFSLICAWINGSVNLMILLVIWDAIALIMT